MNTRIPFILILLLAVATVKAESVPESVARIAAERIFGKNTQKSTSHIELKHVGIEKGDTVYFVYGYADGGFAIISADNDVNPVLGYSLASKAGDVAENKPLMYQLDRYGRKISELKSQNQSRIDARRQWQPYIDAIDDKSSYKIKAEADSADGELANEPVPNSPLITSQWDQVGLYNDSCPTYVGCVALAMGQIMRYYKWPEKGRGSHSYIPHDDTSYGRQHANFGATTYHWDLMPDKLRDYSTPESKVAVAQLLYHAGVAVDMSYTKDFSGAFSCDVMPAMANYFRYNPNTMRICIYDEYDADAWFALMKNEIDCKRPVYCSGASQSGDGHAWIVDGYDSRGYLHVNWGWGGDYDGYYLIDNMVLESTFYSNDIDAVIGIQPDNESPMLWTMQASGFRTANRGISNISAVDEYTAWASAFDGLQSNGQCIDYCKTTDGGETWQSRNINFNGFRNYSISMISAVSADEAWAAVYVCVDAASPSGGKIVHTSDGGISWNIQPTATFDGKDAFPNIVHFWDSKNGVCIGDPNGGYFEIYTTTDGGEKWTRVPASRIPANRKDEKGLVASYAVCGDHIYFSTDNGRLFRSADRGFSWTVSQTPLTDNFAIAFRNDGIGVIKGTVTDRYAGYSTADGGDTWSLIASHDRFYPTAIGYIPGTDTLVSVGDYFSGGRFISGISYSTDDDQSFTNYADFYSDVDIYTALCFSPDGKSSWIGSYNFDPYYKGMWHRGPVKPKRGVGIATRRECADVPVSIYPNPTDGQINVECAKDIVRIDIVSVFGTILKSESAGAGNVTLNLGDLPKGMYIVRVHLVDSVSSGRVVVD